MSTRSSKSSANVKALIGQNLDGAQVKAIALSRGNDGVIQFRPNGIIGGIAAYQPSQIKSATGNYGAFDPSTPDIRLSRASILTPAQRSLTKTDKFAEWFGQSKMKAQDGTPLLFMHGTPSSFEAFSNDALGSSSSHTSAGLGHFFTRDMATAQKYAQGGTVLKGWLRIERPYVMKLSEAHRRRR